MTSFTQRFALLLAGSALCGAALMAGVQAKAPQAVATKTQPATPPKVKATKSGKTTVAKSTKKTAAKSAKVNHRGHRTGTATKNVKASKPASKAVASTAKTTKA